MAVHRFRGFYLFRDGAIRRQKAGAWIDYGKIEERSQALPEQVGVELRHAWTQWKASAL